MKKIIGIFLFSLILVGCGKSAEDIAKEKQAQEQALKIKQEQERKLKEQAELKKVEDAVRYYLKEALLHKDLKVKTSHIYSNLSDNSGMWSA
ncbi:hypothetical protein OIN69_14760 [Acinetobacter baumannii]|nr:hypothetical protein [Acinetobacter baumannii]